MSIPFSKCITFIGDIFCDILAKDVSNLPSWGSDSLASSIQLQPGGSCLNSIVHAAAYAKLCLKATPSQLNLSIFSAVGFSDGQGELCLNYLKSFSPMISNCAVKKENSITGSCIVISGANDRCFVTDRGCIADLSISWFKRQQLLTGNHLHLAGYYNCTHMVSHSQETVSLFMEAQNQGITTSINPQYDATGKWDHIQELCPHLTFFFCNEDELLNITKASNNFVNNDNGQVDDNTSGNNNNSSNDSYNGNHKSPHILRAVDVLLKWGCQHAVITHSSRGATVYYYNSTDGGNVVSNSYHNNNLIQANLFTTIETVYQPGILLPAELVVDSTGAGDAFIGAFLVAWQHQQPQSRQQSNGSVYNDITNINSDNIELKSHIEVTLRHACIAGATAVTLIGGSTVPTSIDQYMNH